MSITMYTASVPVFKQLLESLDGILTKAVHHTAETQMDSHTLLQASLHPDMYNFTRQIQIAADFAKGVCARLAGMEVPAFDDTESSFEELHARLAKTIAFITSIDPDTIVGSENREIITRPGTPKERKFNGQNYLFHYGLPQFFFHVTTAYDILRHKGVDIGKRDYMGNY